MPTDVPAIYIIIRALLGGLVSALALGWIGMKLAWQIKLIDRPGSAPHKQHSRPTALGGGIALYLALLACSIWLGTARIASVRATLIAGGLVFLFGLVDDYRILPPWLKLLGQTVAVIVLIQSGVYVKIFESPEFFFHGTGPLYMVLDWLVTLFWVLGITNAFNFVDSMDGLAIGLGAMTAAFFALLTLESQQFELMLHSTLLLGLCVGLYLYNSPPAMLFMGDSGAQTLGFVLAVLAIAYRPQSVFQSSSWFVPIILLGVPIFDTTLIVFSRLRRGLPIYNAGRDHTYHRLVYLLESPNRAVLVMQTAALVLSCIAVVGLYQPPKMANTIFLSLLAAGFMALIYLETRSPWK